MIINKIKIMNFWIIFAIIWAVVYAVCLLFIDEDKTMVDNSILPTRVDCLDFLQNLNPFKY